MKKICSAVVLAAFALTVSAQSASDTNQSYSGTNSPYSQYGLGELVDQSSGFNRGMNGLGLAFREHNQVNQLNPASYSSIDSLSFIFDVGISGQLTNFKEGKNVVHHTYRYRMSSAVYQSFSVPYWLKPAMRWANHQIDDFTLRIKVDKTAKQFCIENDDMWKAAQWRVAEGAGKVHTLKNEWTEYYEFSLRNGIVEWHAKNFRPTSDFTITSPENLLFYRDGDNSMKLGRYYDRSLTYLLPFEMMQETDDGARFLYDGTTDGIPNKRILRNLPYAHRGYVFKDQKLAAYFKSLWWYMPDPNWQQDTSDFTEEEWKLIREAKEE